MKKGKANVPASMRGDYQKRKQMSEQRDEMIQSREPGEDGAPVFNLYVRTKRANLWYPCGSFKGDEKSKALCTSYRDDGILAGISKSQLDKGVSGSLNQDLDRLKESICRTYPQLRKAKDEFDFGYKLAFAGLSEEQEKMILVTPAENKNWLASVKDAFSFDN